MRYRLYGCFSPKYLEVLANLLSKLQFERSLVVYGEIGIPEISNVGKTIIIEQNGKKIKKYVVKPEELGVREAKTEDIKTGDKERNVIDFLRILQGKDKGAKTDLVALNAGASLYTLKDVTTIQKGVKKAKDILSSGASYKVLEKLIKKIGSLNMLKDWNSRVS